MQAQRVLTVTQNVSNRPVRLAGVKHFSGGTMSQLSVEIGVSAVTAFRVLNAAVVSGVVTKRATPEAPGAGGHYFAPRSAPNRPRLPILLPTRRRDDGRDTSTNPASKGLQSRMHLRATS